MTTYLRAYYHCKPSESDARSERLFAKGVWRLTEHHEDTLTRIEALLAFSNAYSHVMTQVDGFAARYPHNKVFLSLQQDLARGALHL